jgi:anti-sigma-K factor RskA
MGEPGTSFALGGFETLPSDRNYQLWAMRDDDAISLGVFNTDDEGNWAGDMDVPLEHGDQIALTEEVAGGSSEPTMEPLISTQI